MISINRIVLRDAWARYVYADTRPRYRNAVEVEREAFRGFDTWFADTHDRPASNPYEEAPCGC